MRLVESDFGRDCAGNLVCLKRQSNGIDSMIIEYDAIADYIRNTFNKGNMLLDVRDMLVYRGVSGGKVMFKVTDYDISDGVMFSLFGMFVDISGGKPHQTEYTKRLEEVANTGGRYYLDIVMGDSGIYVKTDNTACMLSQVKDIVVVMNPFVFAPWSIGMTGEVVLLETDRLTKESDL